MIIEVIGTSVSDVLTAQEAGADRIELCQAMEEGGLTPSYALINQVVKHAKIPIHVMIRPHSHSFYYSKEDVRIMYEDILIAKELGVDGVVFGCLTKDAKIDHDVLSYLLQAADGLNVTFHRAFDEIENQKQALRELASYKAINTILTSGGARKALQAVDTIVQLITLSDSTHLTIMPGSGLHADNIHELLPFAKALHIGTGVRYDTSYANPIEPALIRKVKEIV